MTARNTRILVMTAAFLAGLVLCFGVVLIVTGRLSSPVAQQIAAIGGPFKLTDQNGQTVTDQDLKGRPFLVFFGFTHCPDVCPTALFEMSEILRAMGGDAKRMNAFFVSEARHNVRMVPLLVAGGAAGLAMARVSGRGRAERSEPPRAPASERVGPRVAPRSAAGAVR